MKLTLNKSIRLWLLIVLASCGLTAGFLHLTGKEAPLPTASMAEPIVKDPVPQQRWVDPSAPPPMSKRIVEYHMSVALQTETNSLSGSQIVTWENPGKKPVEELYFHLYPNAFESKKTSFYQESGGKLRKDEHQEDSFGSMEIQSMKTVDGHDLASRMQFIQPDDGNIHDRTLMKVTLPAAVQPGQTVTLSMDYTVKLPRVFARMGYADDFYMAGQWFPKIAVYEPAGTRGPEEGWNLHQYHGNSEFYADFGIYDVKIKVPASYIVAATGFPTKTPVEQNGTKTYRFYADDVHDFAWAASPNFKYYEEPFSTAQIPGVRIKLYLDPKHEHLKQRYMQAAKKSLARYSEWYGSYPYSTLSIVVPPGDANGAGGMEYPTLITAWGAQSEHADLSLERVVVHEIGHQFFHGMVASNEFEEAWLDEGFTSYAEDKVMEEEFGIKPNVPLEASYITSPASLTKNAWAYSSHGEYAENVYTRGKLVLLAIENEIGEDQMHRVMRTYFQRWKFRHPSTQDFQKVLEEVSGRDWSDFFNEFINGHQMIDYAVDSIVVREVSQQGIPQYENEVKVVQKGARHHTVPIRFYFEDGTALDKVWDSQGSQIVFKLTHSAGLSRVVIDPEHSLVLENRHINNFMKAEIDSRWSIRWNVGIVKLLEILFNWVS